MTATGHRSRRRARRVALDILYEADLLGRAPTVVAGEWEAAGKSVPDYAAELVRGIQDDLPAIDDRLGASSEEWTVQRMAAVDRAILRVACYELNEGTVPPAVAINEAVEAANELSTGDSGRFINGVLGRIARAIGIPDVRER
jgi:transcription antitermination protein NusB